MRNDTRDRNVYKGQELESFDCYSKYFMLKFMGNGVPLSLSPAYTWHKITDL